MIISGLRRCEKFTQEDTTVDTKVVQFRVIIMSGPISATAASVTMTPANYAGHIIVHKRVLTQVHSLFLYSHSPMGRLHVFLFISPAALSSRQRCLLGYMTDVQDWVDEIGSLRPRKDDVINSFDLSGTINPVPTLHTMVNEIQRTSTSPNTVKYLSLARCQLTRIPHIFGFRDSEGRWLSDTLEYVSFYGNSFIGMGSDDQYTMSFNATGATEMKPEDGSYNIGANMWSSGLASVRFNKLKELDLRACSIQTLGEDVFQGMESLTALYIGENEINYIAASAFVAWFDKQFTYMPKLKFLTLKNNNINIISEEMIADVLNVHYLALSGNFIVCNCHAKDLYKMAYKNQVTQHTGLLKAPTNGIFHSGFAFYNKIIEDRMDMFLSCDKNCLDDIEVSGKFKLVDYTPTSYKCLYVSESRSMLVSEVTSCKRASREVDYDAELANGRLILLSILIIPCLLLPVAGIYMFRRHLRYCFITMRNSAMLSIITKNETIDEGTVFNYDVFVSYCNEDRGWVLDHLLPHIEAECSISACLHERDFQVGLSILENIVSCMDRSRSIMLIISQRFLLSHWCQFEMHLAQHRLLETRREDLTLVLLEDIPRRLRPNTLHYLMVTKTYIVWPKDEGERGLFWRRLKKTLISQKTKQAENVSLA
ncbi:unnamed protein product [Chrysodeixis includens]|uniref:TIR domain-containing protein n=1 Tax=Chrysodeixis includens TaxID=689277 RepID=A0A9N8KX39_CHRIL|nr:unnamed protein product [Chrysodeixis includens]